MMGSTEPRIRLDRSAFEESRGVRSLAVRHDLAAHPMLTLDAIAVLAEGFPPGLVEHNVGTSPRLDPDATAPALDTHPLDVVRGIEHNGCWMVFRYVHRVPEYRELLDRLLDPIAAIVGPMGEREAFLFLSGTGSITPWHRDPEHNFLLQVRGTKQFSTGSFPDDEAKHRSLERVYRAHGRNSELAAIDPITYTLGPGDGVYLPTDALHLVENGPEVSISFSVTWRPRDVVRLGRVYELNGWLRARGRSPRPPGRSRVVDRLKSGVVWSRLAARRLLPRRVRRG